MLTFTVCAQQHGCRLNVFLRSQGVSGSLVRAVKYTPNGICANGQQVHTNYLVQAGDTITFNDCVHTQTAVIAQDIPLEIVYEDEQVMVLNKPAGLAVHPTLNYPNGTLANAFCGEMQRRGVQLPFRAVGRLDKNTSGLVVCAMTAYSAPLLAQTMHKTYYAIAEGVIPENGTIDAPIGYAPNSVIRHAVVQEGRPAVTHYTVLGTDGTHTLLRITLETGRTHQIRVHLAYIGHPLAGDDFYGGSTQLLARHALHCGEVTLVQPVTHAPLHCGIALAQDMTELAKKMKFEYNI